MIDNEVTQFDMIDDLDTIYPDLMMQSSLIDEGALHLDPHLFQVDPNAEGCTFVDGILELLNSGNGDPQKAEQMESPTVAPGEIQGASKDDGDGDKAEEEDAAQEKVKAVTSVGQGERKTAEGRRLARAERNRIYARQSRLRLKLHVESLEGKVLAKRKVNVELRDKLEAYFTKFQKASREMDAQSFGVEQAAVGQALAICRDAREKCAWTYRMAAKQQIEIKETTGAARNETS